MIADVISNLLRKIKLNSFPEFITVNLQISFTELALKRSVSCSFQQVPSCDGSWRVFCQQPSW